MVESVRETRVFEEIEAIQASLGQILGSEIIDRFSQVWYDIGLEEDKKSERREAMKEHMLKMLAEMAEEEENLKQKLKESAHNCLAEVEKLCKELGKIPDSIDPKETLLNRERKLRASLDKLNKEKHERLKRLKRLTEVETALCTSLGRKTRLMAILKGQTVPTEEELQNYRKDIEELENIKSNRQATFFTTREAILVLWEALGYTPEDSFEETVLAGDSKSFPFTEENIDKLIHLKEKYEGYDKEVSKQMRLCREQIESLWLRLEITSQEQQTFWDACTGTKYELLEKMEFELQRLEELKRANMRKFIESTRSDLVKVWDQCLFGAHQRKQFDLFNEEEYTEDTLSAHESELDKWRGFYADHVELFKLIAKREELFAKMVDFDYKASDPSRFNNRGGQLLKEERARKKINKELPKIEQDLKRVLIQWEDDYEKPFLVNDCRYLETIDRQWKNFQEEKEHQKEIRHKAKAEITAIEMTYGSVPASPTKRKAPITPNKVPSKVRKVTASPLLKSTQSTSGGVVTRQGLRPKTATGCPITKMAAKPPKTPKKLVKNPAPRKILVEYNGSPSHTFLVGNEDTSLASTISTYSEFQKGLKMGLNEDKNARSSCIPKSSSTQSLDL